MFGIDHFFITTISRQSVDFIAYYFITFEFSACGLVFFFNHKSAVIAFYEIFILEAAADDFLGSHGEVVNTSLSSICTCQSTFTFIPVQVSVDSKIRGLILEGQSLPMRTLTRASWPPRNVEKGWSELKARVRLVWDFQKRKTGAQIGSSRCQKAEFMAEMVGQQSASGETNFSNRLIRNWRKF